MGINGRSRRRIGSGAIVVVALALALTACTSTPTTTAAPGTTAASTKFVDANAVDLTGAWESKVRHNIIGGNRGEGRETVTISEQKDALFNVSRAIEVQVPAEFEDGQPKTTSATVTGVGVINPDGSITVVKGGDAGRVDAWLTDKDTMEWVYAEGGDEQVVVRQTLKRKSA